MAGKLSRRQLIQLFIFAVFGAGVGHMLQRVAPIGSDVSSNSAARALLHDSSSPSREVAKPTLTLVVFTDYQCSACKLASPAMNAALEKDGQVRVVYRDWPIFGAISERAARMAIASDRQGIYSAVHTRLMNARGPLDDHVIYQAVIRSGGSWSQLQSDLLAYESDVQSQLDQNRKDAFRLGLSGTPAYLAGPILVSGGLSEEEFTTVFAQAREMLEEL